MENQGYQKINKRNRNGRTITEEGVMELASYMSVPSISGATETSLILSDDIPYEEWELLGTKIQRCTRACMWWLGDWWVFGEHHYGERASQAVEIDYSFQTLANAGWICRQIETSRRREVLSFSHHAEVASLESKIQDKLLDAAAKSNMSTRELRKTVRDYKAALNKLNPGPLPEGKYRIIYADPPWKYNDERNLDGYDSNAASNSYPTMSLQELIELNDENGKPVTDLFADQCILFLWTTAPLQEDSHKLMRAWGLVYKTSFIWNKVRPGMGGLGHYHYTNHEMLLVGTRGSYILVEKKFHSVQELEKTNKHSEKPELFRNIIDSMYPQTEEKERIELFRRGDTPKGWRVWGNEAG